MELIINNKILGTINVSISENEAWIDYTFSLNGNPHGENSVTKLEFFSDMKRLQNAETIEDLDWQHLKTI